MTHSVSKHCVVAIDRLFCTGVYSQYGTDSLIELLNDEAATVGTKQLRVGSK